MSKNIRLQPRDIKILEKVIDFNGLPSQDIIQKFFNTERYGYERLQLLRDNGYLKRVYYYAPRKKGDQTLAQRVGGIDYATPKALREVGCTIDPRFVVPNEDKLDVTNLVGELFREIPELLSKRQAIEKYGLKNFMPITCAIPHESPVFIYILGSKVGRQEPGRIAGFIKSGTFPDAKHIIVSRTFREKLNIPDAYFIPWIFAPTHLPNLAKDPHYYLKEFLTLAKHQFPGIKFLNSTPEPFIKAEHQGRLLHLSELFSGSNLLRLNLQEPPENTYIYAPSRRHFQGVKLRKGSFLFYSQEDQGVFQMSLKNKRMGSLPYKIL